MIKAGIGIGPHDVVAIRLIAETPAVADPGSVPAFAAAFLDADRPDGADRK